MQGDLTHTNTLRFDDGVVEVAFTVTAQGFDASGNPAPLFANMQAVGIGVGMNQTLDPGEEVKFTINNIAYTQIGPDPSGGMVDLPWAKSYIKAIRMAGDFDQGVDTYTYTGVGEANIQDDDTNQLLFVPFVEPTPATQLHNGSMLRLTVDTGSFRVLFLSLPTFYPIKAIPEPATVSILGLAIAGVLLVRRCATKK